MPSLGIFIAFMNKRIKKAILNQPLKTILFIFIMFVLFLSLSLSFVFKSASNLVYSQINTVLKPQVVIKANNVIKNDTERAFSPFYTHKIDSSLVWEELNEQYYDDINHLLNRDEVYFGDLSIYTNSSLYLVPYRENEGFIIQEPRLELLSEDSVKRNAKESEEYYFGSVSYGDGAFNSRLASVSKENYSDRFYSKDSLIAGRYLTQEEIDNGDYKIVLNGIPYCSNGETYKEFKIGDVITYSLIDRENKEVLKEYEFEIVGITLYASKAPNTYDYNLIPEKTFLEIMNECYQLVKGSLYVNEYERSFIGPYSYFPSIITLKSLESLESFLSKIEDLNNKGREYTYETSANDYIVIAGQLESLKASFEVLFIFSIIASLLILFSLITLDMFNRQKEIGILLAIGESKKRLAIGIILEYLIKITISLIIALIVTNFIIPYISDMLISTDMIINNTSTFIINNVTASDLELNVTLSIKNIIKIILLALAITLPSIISSLLYILRSNVKEIMLNE